MVEEASTGSDANGMVQQTHVDYPGPSTTHAEPQAFNKVTTSCDASPTYTSQFPENSSVHGSTDEALDREDIGQSGPITSQAESLVNSTMELGQPEAHECQEGVGEINHDSHKRCQEMCMMCLRMKRMAVLAEYQALLNNDTWEIVTLPAG
ncbi:hypothetical protein V6N12_007506 [Hibiscus sabdariffa]|uniref:Uncharacterized protein n=1 Tax=Hibiscus sabdariffa TaxID=183260 RepID=A0ABR2F1Z7_9ROSI